MEKDSVKSSNTSGFTLVEIMIVVMIIGLLAAMVFPSFESARRNSQNTRLATDLRVYGGAITMFAIANREFPEDSNSGAVPSGFEQFINVGSWNKGPSIGGVWDMEFNSYGITSAVGVHGFNISEDQLIEFDEQHDDGDISTGRYRLIAGDRYYYVVSE